MLSYYLVVLKADVTLQETMMTLQQQILIYSKCNLEVQFYRLFHSADCELLKWHQWDITSDIIVKLRMQPVPIANH